MPPTPSTSDLIADALREGIDRGEPAPGSPLRQEAIAAQFGVSRLPVRDALRKLEAEGFVVVHPNRGAFVTGHTSAEVEEIFDIRRLLEVNLLARAVRAMDDAALREIENAMLAGEREALGPRWSDFDDAFHVALYAPAKRARQSRMIAELRATVRRYRMAHAALPEAASAWLDDHRAILAACKAGKGREACRILDDHLGRAGRFIVDRLG